jgi:putative ABC transport system ATP-binding protein
MSEIEKGGIKTENAPAGPFSDESFPGPENSRVSEDIKNFDDKKKPEDKAPFIEFNDVNIIYNQKKSNEVRALENINLKIYPEEFVIIYGPSGCGKSTLLYAISGLQRLTSGSVIIGGDNIAKYKKNQLAEFHQKKIGMVFQAFHLISSINVRDNVCLPKVFESEEEEKRNERARTLLERFNILNQSEKFPGELSGGQKQRVSISRALINNPDIILADEPVGNLDSKSAHNVMMILKELNELDKKTIVLVTHDPAHLSYGNRIIHMRDGKIIKIEKFKQSRLPASISSTGSFIFKEGKIKEELQKMGMIKEEYIPADIKLLIKAFRNLNISQVGALLIPFKADQLFSHIFLSMTNEQIESAKKRLENYMYGRIDLEKLRKELDEPFEKGGAGWDKRLTDKFISSVNQINEESNKIDFSQKEQSAAHICSYISSRFSVVLEPSSKKKLEKLLLDRMENRIGVDEFIKIMDMPVIRGGLGLNKKTAEKIAREIEMLLLIRYSA